MSEKEGKMIKISQVSVFIIFAVILIAAGALAFVINKRTSEANLDKDFFTRADIKPQLDSLKNSIEDCMKNTCSDAVDLIGIQGGYYKEPKEYFDLGWAFIPYYYKQGLFLMPAKQDIEKQISMYVDDNLKTCIDNINKGDFNIVYSNSKTRTTIEKKNVKFEINMPVSIGKEDKTIKIDLKDSPIVQQSNLLEVLEIAKYISDSHIEDPNMICISCVSDMARERNLYVDMVNFEEDSTLFVISDNSTLSIPYNFEFLNMY